MNEDMGRYFVREVLHTLLAVGVTVVVAVAAELVDIGSFSDVSLSGLAVTAVRSGATATVTVLSKYVIKRGK